LSGAGIGDGEADIKLEATAEEVSEDEKLKMKSKSSSKVDKEEIDDNERESRERVALKSEDDEDDVMRRKKRAHNEFEDEFLRIVKSLSFKGFKRISISDLGSTEIISRGLLHATLRGRYNGDEVVFRKYPFPSSISDDDKNVKEYLEEDDRRRRARHSNIVEYFGFCFDMPNFGFVTRYYSQGSLHDALIGDSKREFSLKQLTKFALDIASGVRVYHNEGLSVHVIATRNVMLDGTEDFPVARLDLSFEPSEIDFKYGKQRAYVGPVSWLAPEAMESKKYTPQSDSFSFGVFLWELVSRENPFSERTTIEVACPVIHKNLRLKVPSGAPRELAELMERCFHTEPQSRPTIDEIHKVLSVYHDSL